MEITVFDVTDSTNAQAKKHIGRASRMLFVANEQTSGRGRLGKTFFSPRDTGIYMTYVFETDSQAKDTVRITTAAAAAVTLALESVCKTNFDIKWVNDIYKNGKKVCGILVEAVTDYKSGKICAIIIGVGINVTTESFPDDLCDKAGAINPEGISREKIIAKICDNLYQLSNNIESGEYVDYYRTHLVGVGRQITYTENGKNYDAVIVGIDDMCGLIVLQDGKQKILRSGEITIGRI